METRTLQQLIDAFNTAYFRACESSDGDDWLAATLAGRHLVNGLTEKMDLVDILPVLQKREPISSEHIVDGVYET
jgi:hypothetical protein